MPQKMAYSHLDKARKSFRDSEVVNLFLKVREDKPQM
jgi:hypothetical protein